MVEHQDIFDQPVEEMVRIRSPHYLRAWINMFYSLVLLSDRIRSRRDPHGNSEGESTVTYDTMDLAEYLVDATDGMDREWDIGNAGAVQTSPHTAEGRNVEQLEGLIEGRVRNPYKKH